MKKSILASVAALTLLAAPSVAFAGTEKAAHPANAVVHVHKAKTSAAHKTAAKKSTKTAPKKTVAKKPAAHKTSHKTASKSTSKSKKK
ncbi:hypothetical protein [Alicyclobacillus sendaiensis]|uniref:Acid shock protein n=1 Tax=Alicyclobacillus sendaiensis PA2 TaxID=3029425 RepID=A0ABT6XY93_ALISE|nr:hypothetical protein [Alicyclobacillus sendaiensis]MDI9260053.1 hypothetical protein [Alicyclobacillus sendaiensis PA2]